MKFLRSTFLPLAAVTALLFTSCGKKDDATAPAPTPTPTPSTAPVKSAEKTSFGEVTAQLDPGGSLYFYLSTEQWLAGLATSLGTLRETFAAPAAQPNAASRAEADRALQVLENVVRESGLQEVTGLGASSITLAPGLHRNKVFVHHEAGKGDGFLWTAFGKAPHALAPVAMLPPQTALAAFSDLDLGVLVKVARDQVAASGSPEAQQALDQGLLQFSAAAGMTLDEALASLGGSAGIIVTLDPAKPMQLPMPNSQPIPTPRVALIFKTNDDRIFQRIDAAMGPTPGLEKVDEAELKMRTMALPLGPEMMLRPTAAQWDGWLIIASDDALVRDIMAAKKSGQGFAATPEYKKLTEGLPTEGNGFSLATELFTKTILGFQREMMRNSPGTTPEQAALMEKLLAYQDAGANYSISMHRPDGWLTIGQGSQGAGQLLAPLVIAPVAVLAGVALPVFSKAKEKGTTTKSLSNAKQIALGCKLWAMDNDGAFPPSLDVLVPDYIPTPQVFVSPFAPNEPNGYTYHAGLTETSPPDTVLIEDTFAPASGKSVVVRVDLSGETK